MDAKVKEALELRELMTRADEVRRRFARRYVTLLQSMTEEEFNALLKDYDVISVK